MAVSFILLSHGVVKLVLRPEYAATGWMLQLLGFRSALELFGSAASAMLLAVGVTRYAAIGNSSRVIFLIIGLTIAFSFFGLKEAIWVLACSPCVQYVAMLIGLQRRCRFVIRTELVCIVIFIAVVSLSAFLCYSGSWFS